MLLLGPYHFCPLSSPSLHEMQRYLTFKGVITLGFPGGSVVKNLPAAAGDARDLWVREIPWRTTWQPIPAFLPGKFHRRRSLVGYSPWVCRESNTTEHTLTTYIAALSCFHVTMTFRGPPCGRVLSYGCMVFLPGKALWLFLQAPRDELVGCCLLSLPQTTLR